MPIGKNNDDLNKTGDTFNKGTPITEPKVFGTPITTPHDFGNDVPVSDATKNSNPVTWTPSPAHFGNNNPTGVLPTAATPIFSPGTGTYASTQSVTITSATAGASIYFTTDGSTPTTGSTLYTGPVSVAVNETLKAIAVAAGFTNSVVGSATYSFNGFFRSITIDHTKVQTADQTNFPVLVSVTNATLKTVANGGHVQNANGNDIHFTSDSAGSSLLNWEIDTYDPVNGILNAWVKVVSLSASVDTVIYMQYGNAANSTNQQNPSALWTGYAGVYHLGDGTTLSLADSSPSANALIQHGTITAATGKIGGGSSHNLNAANYLISTNNVSGLGGTTARTLSFWEKTTTTASFQDMAGYGTNFTNQLFQPFVQGNWKLNLWGANDWDTGVAADTNMDHIVVTYDGTKIHYYVNGSEINNETLAINTANGKIWLGLRPDLNFPFSGVLDEVRLTSALRDANWIKTEYNNQNSPSTFSTLGSESGH